MENTLVLDLGYRPVAREPWQVAIVKVLVDRVAEVVEAYPDKYIHAPNFTVELPSVIRLLKPIRRKRAVKFSRQNVWVRDKGRCQYCGAKVPRYEFTYEHVIPRSQGGVTTWENVVVACVPCNQRKGGRTPAQAGMHLLSTPVKPKKLPDSSNFAMTFQEGMPESWRNWLRSAVYWNTELEQ